MRIPANEYGEAALYILNYPTYQPSLLSIFLTRDKWQNRVSLNHYGKSRISLMEWHLLLHQYLHPLYLVFNQENSTDCLDTFQSISYNSLQYYQVEDSNHSRDQYQHVIFSPNKIHSLQSMIFVPFQAAHKVPMI